MAQTKGETNPRTIRKEEGHQVGPGPKPKPTADVRLSRDSLEPRLEPKATDPKISRNCLSATRSWTVILDTRQVEATNGLLWSVASQQNVSLHSRKRRIQAILFNVASVLYALQSADPTRNRHTIQWVKDEKTIPESRHRWCTSVSTLKVCFCTLKVCLCALKVPVAHEAAAEVSRIGNV